MASAEANKNAELHYKKMTETPVHKLVLRLGLPTTISMLITNIYNMADTYFVGGLSESAQGAIGILFTLQAIIQAIAFMLGHGSGTYVSKELSHKNIDKASGYVSTAFFLGGGAGLILMTVGLIFIKPFMLFLGSTETILPYAVDYGTYVLLSCPLLIMSLILNNNLRYEGKAFYAMIGLTTGGLLNIFGDWLLVSKFNFGVAGAGIATAVSQLISFVILLIMYFKNAQTKIRLKSVSLKAKMILSIVAVGLPSLIRQGLSSISSGLLNNLSKPFGDSAIAAMSIVGRYTNLVLCVGLGIGQGFQPVCSFNYAAGKIDRVKKALTFTVLIGFVLMTVLAVPGIVAPEKVIWIFQKKPQVIECGKNALMFASIGALFLPLSVTANMLYQSIQKAATASFLAMLRSGLVFIPCLLLFSWLWDFTGIQLAQPVADALSGLISLPFLIAFIKKASCNEPLSSDSDSGDGIRHNADILDNQEDGADSAITCGAECKADTEE